VIPGNLLQIPTFPRNVLHSAGQRDFSSPVKTKINLRTFFICTTCSLFSRTERCASIRRTDWWVLCREMMAIHCESQTEHINNVVMSVTTHMQTTMAKGLIFNLLAPEFYI